MVIADAMCRSTTAMKTFCVIVLCILAFDVRSQVLGADLYYKALEENKLEITLNVFYSCIENPPGIQQVFLLESDNNKAYAPIELKQWKAEKISTVEQSTCNTNTPCYLKVTYKTTFVLPPIPVAFILNWQNCCSPIPFENIDGMKNAGLNISVTVPAGYQKNSSATFNRLPLFEICGDRPSSTGFDANDADGDSLAYEIIAPVASTLNNSSPKNLISYQSFSPVEYKEGYSSLQPFGDNSVKLQQTESRIELTPKKRGNFMWAYQVNEYRNKKLISTHQRVLITTVNQ